MTYYLLLSGDTDKDYHDTNVLGEESFGKFYTGQGMRAVSYTHLTLPTNREV